MGLTPLYLALLDPLERGPLETFFLGSKLLPSREEHERTGRRTESVIHLVYYYWSKFAN